MRACEITLCFARICFLTCVCRALSYVRQFSDLRVCCNYKHTRTHTYLNCITPTHIKTYKHTTPDLFLKFKCTNCLCLDHPFTLGWLSVFQAIHQHLNKINNAQHRRHASSPAHYPMPETTNDHLHGKCCRVRLPDYQLIQSNHPQRIAITNRRPAPGT